VLADDDLAELTLDPAGGLNELVRVQRSPSELK